MPTSEPALKFAQSEDRHLRAVIFNIHSEFHTLSIQGFKRIFQKLFLTRVLTALRRCFGITQVEPISGCARVPKSAKTSVSCDFAV